MIGWYKTGSSAGFIGAVVGAMILFALYHIALKKQPNIARNSELVLAYEKSAHRLLKGN